MTAPADLRAALVEALDLIDSGYAYCSDCDRGGKLPELRALAETPPSVRELTASAGFRAGAHLIRFDVDGLRRELRVQRLPRARGQRGPDAYAVESRTVRYGVGGEWRWWLPTLDALDAPGQLVEVSDVR